MQIDTLAHQDYRISPALLEFARNGLADFDGMLNKGGTYMAALATTILGLHVGWQDKAFLEIGVYKGKFFSLIERASRGSNYHLVGVDPFVMRDQSKEEVLRGFAERGLEMNRITLQEAYSADVQAIESAIGGRPLTLCHIDGSHAEADVYADFSNVDRLLADDGIVIGDDFWHKSQLQVMTAIFRLVLEDRVDLKPFMLANSKIYMCRARHVDRYKETFIEAFRQNGDMEMFAAWLDAHQQKKWFYTEQFMSKWRVIII